MNWNFDMASAPRGEELARVVKTAKGDRLVPHYEHVRIIAAGNKGIVTLSRWLPNEERWEMFTKDVPPFAWMPWPTAPEVPS